MAVWFNSWTFLITATTIVSGCLAERAAFEAYLAYTPLMAGAVFPLAVHWAFNGWLSDIPCSFIDFAGGSTVHLLGGAGQAAGIGDADEGNSIGATGRSQADAPEIDGHVYLRDVAPTLKAGDVVMVIIEDADEHDLFGVVS